MRSIRWISILCILFAGMAGLSFLAADDESTDDFFAQEPEPPAAAPADAVPADAASIGAASTDTAPAADGSSVQNAVPSDGGWKPERNAAPAGDLVIEDSASADSAADNNSNDADAPQTAVNPYPLDAVIPGDSLLIFRTIRLSKLNDKLQYLFEQIGFGKLSPVDWLKLSPLADAVSALDMKRSAAVVYLIADPSEPLAPVIYLPTNDFSALAASLGGKSTPAEGDSAAGEPAAEGPVELEKPAGWSAFWNKGYAVLYESKYTAFPARLTRTAPYAPNRYTESGLKNPDGSLEITERGVRVFTALIHSAVRDFYPVLLDSLQAMDQADSDAQEQIGTISARTDAVLRRMSTNLHSARFDFRITPSGVVTAAAVRPYPNTPMARQLADTGGPATPTLLNGPEFLKVVPNSPAPLAGQTDVTPETASAWGAPFDRVRHIEYSLALPAAGELLAESWCFFLEVDDTKAFVEELIVPKAQLIGSHIGAEKLGEFGAQLLGNITARRQANGRRTLFASPQEAAARGEELGASLGSSIGADIGEKEAMKTYDFEGHELLISDLVLYTQQMKKIRAQQRGEDRPVPVQFNGNQGLIGQLLSGLESGSLEGSIRDRYGDDMTSSEDDMLLARRNLILVLDETHLLIVPGNESVLHNALERWRLYTEGKLPAGAADAPWRLRWNALCAEMNNPSNQLLRSAAQFDLNAAKIDADFIRRDYMPNLPVLMNLELPVEIPQALAVSTTGPESAFFYTLMPNNLVKVLKDQALSKKNAKGAEDSRTFGMPSGMPGGTDAYGVNGAAGIKKVNGVRSAASGHRVSSPSAVPGTRSTGRAKAVPVHR